MYYQGLEVDPEGTNAIADIRLRRANRQVGCPEGVPQETGDGEESHFTTVPSLLEMGCEEGALCFILPNPPP